jgi:hypothetical protein
MKFKKRRNIMTKKLSPNVKIKEAAEILGKCQQFVRLGIQQGVFDFGVAVLSRNGKKYSYQISRAKLDAYIGSEDFLKLCEDDENEIEEDKKFKEEEVISHDCNDNIKVVLETLRMAEEALLSIDNPSDEVLSALDYIEDTASIAKLLGRNLASSKLETA